MPLELSIAALSEWIPLHCLLVHVIQPTVPLRIQSSSSFCSIISESTDSTHKYKDRYIWFERERYSIFRCRLYRTIPCLRTSSTAAMSSSLRSWLSLAICSPFSRKFWVACSTDTARTWAFLERPFFLLDGPLLLVFTSVVTYEWRTGHCRWFSNNTIVWKQW